MTSTSLFILPFSPYFINFYNFQMAQLNYGDVLEYFGLSNWQFMSLLFLVLIVYSVAAMFHKMGALGKIKVDRKFMPSFKAIYISYEGSYDDIGVIYRQSVEDFQMVFKFSNYFAIYYSDFAHPNDLSKAILGIAVNTIEEGKMPLFFSKFPMYKQTSFGVCQCLTANYPLVNSISSVMVMGRVYPVLKQKAIQLGVNISHNQIIEIYHLYDKTPSMNIIIPIANSQQFEIWYPPTDYSKVFPKKTL